MSCVESLAIFGPVILMTLVLRLAMNNPIVALVLAAALLIMLLLLLLFDQYHTSLAKPPSRVKNRKHQRQHSAKPALRQCIIDYDDHPIADLPTPFSFSRHYHEANICEDCIVAWLRAEIETKTWDCITCPHPDCKRHLEYEEIKAALVGEKKLFGRFDLAVARAFLSRDKDFLRCFSPACKSGQFHIGSAEQPIFQCNSCGHRHCVVCLVNWHRGQTCRQYQATKAKKDKQNEAKSKKAVERISKPCPGCGTPIQKNGGCNHMTCQRCNYEFCWTCLAQRGRIRTCRQVQLD